MPEAAIQTPEDTSSAAIAVATEQSSSDKSIMGATPTPQPEEEAATGDQGADDQDQGDTGEQASPGIAAANSQDKQQKAPWFQKRIDQLTWEKNEERRSRAAVEEQNKVLLAQLEASRNIQGSPAVAAADPNAQSPASTAATPQAPAKSAAVMSEAEIEARALIKAQQIAAKTSFDKACNAIAEQGNQAYSDFNLALKTFDMLGGIPQPLLEAITDMPNAHKVLYAIGKDPELADRVVKMPVARMGMELARVDAAISKPPVKPVSKAGTPITPIDTTTSGSEQSPDSMTTSEWIKWREKTKKTRW